MVSFSIGIGTLQLHASKASLQIASGYHFFSAIDSKIATLHTGRFKCHSKAEGSNDVPALEPHFSESCGCMYR
jgi:hypothetical protein